MVERGNSLLRRIDAIAGPATLGMLSHVRRRRDAPSDPQSIGLMCFGAIGDLLLFSSLIPCIRTQYPNAKIILMGSDTNAALFGMIDGVEFVQLPATRPHEALKRLRGLSLDLLIDSTQWARMPAVLSALSGAYTIGFRTDGQTRHSCYDTAVEHRNDRHEIENFLALATDVVEDCQLRPPLSIPRGALDSVDSLGLGSFAALHAWPSGLKSHLKEWPTESWT